LHTVEVETRVDDRVVLAQDVVVVVVVVDAEVVEGEISAVLEEDAVGDGDFFRSLLRFPSADQFTLAFETLDIRLLPEDCSRAGQSEHRGQHDREAPPAGPTCHSHARRMRVTWIKTLATDACRNDKEAFALTQEKAALILTECTARGFKADATTRVGYLPSITAAVNDICWLEALILPFPVDGSPIT